MATFTVKGHWVKTYTKTLKNAQHKSINKKISALMSTSEGRNDAAKIAKINKLNSRAYKKKHGDVDYRTGLAR